MPKKAKGNVKKAARKEARVEVRRLAKHRGHEVGSRARTKLEAGTANAIKYVAGLFDPVGRGANVRLPSDGFSPTSCMRGVMRFQVPFATNMTVGSTQSLWGIQVFPDLHYSYRLVTNFVAGGGALTWGGVFQGSTWPTLAAACAVFRGAVNMGVNVHFTAANVALGGEILASRFPPSLAGVSPPATLDQVFTSTSTDVMTIGEFLDLKAKRKDCETDFAWLPASGEGVMYLGAAAQSRTAATWTSPASTEAVAGDNSLVIIGYAPIGYNAATPVLGAQDMSAFIEIHINTEFIPSFGTNQQVYPMRIIEGGSADVQRVMKPVELAANQTGGGSMIASLSGALERLSGMAMGNAQSILATGTKAAGPAGMAVYGAGKWASAGAQALKGNWEQAGGDALEAAVSVMPMLFGKQHTMAVAAGVPYISPLNHYGRVCTKRGSSLGTPATRGYWVTEELSMEEFLSLLQAAVRERTEAKWPEPTSDDFEPRPDVPPPGSRFLADAVRATRAYHERVAAREVDALVRDQLRPYPLQVVEEREVETPKSDGTATDKGWFLTQRSRATAR